MFNPRKKAKIDVKLIALKTMMMKTINGMEQYALKREDKELSL